MFNIFRKSALPKALADQAISHAVAKGVPRKFAKKMVNQEKTMAAAIDVMSKTYDGFSEAEEYVQYAEAVAFLYVGARDHSD